VEAPVHTVEAEPLSDNLGLVAQMRPALVKYFKRKSGSAVEAEDLAQDVLVRVLTHANWKSTGEAKGYIFRAAVNRWRDRHRRLESHGVIVPLDEELEEVGTQNPPECVLIFREELNQIARVLEELNVRTRTVLMLIKFEQMKVATVADMLGISISAVNKHLAKGIARLAELRRQQDERP
jgi:RNA polymerase sigma factor (sigma-70 family)